MTISEANAINHVLRALVAGVKARDLPLTEVEIEAGVILAGKANRVLGAGFTAESFRAAVTR